MMKVKRKTPLPAKIIFGIFLIAAAWAIFFNSNSDKKIESIANSDIDRNFAYAVEDETWEILDDNIAVMDIPETFTTHDVFASHIVTMLNTGEKVTILKTKGIGSQWKYCQVKGAIFGWILAETVKDSKRIN